MGRGDHGEGPGAYTEWQVGGRSVGGMMPKPPMMPAEVPPTGAVYFAVADTDTAVARVVELGGTRDDAADRHRTRPLRGGADPTGAVFNVITLSPELAR